MEYLIGSKKEFLEFIDSVKGNIAFLTHSDLDGIASVIFLEEILKEKGLEENLKFIEFLDYKKEIFGEIFSVLKKKKISNVFITDLSPENVDLEGFEKLRKEFNVFSIDHHPIGKLNDKKRIIKTKTSYCSALTCYELGEGIIDEKEWKWLAQLAAISDMSYKNPEVLKFLQEDYPNITEENIHNSEIGKITSMINSAIIYFDKDIEKVYDKIKGKKIKEFEKYDKEIKKEIDKWIKKYEKEAEYYPEQDLYFYYYNPKFGIRSTVTTIISNKEPDKTFISAGEIPKDKDFVSVSARNQSGKRDMNQLMKKGVLGLENSTAGGHIPAAGGTLMKKDIEKFKKNILG